MWQLWQVHKICSVVAEVPVYNRGNMLPLLWLEFVVGISYQGKETRHTAATCTISVAQWLGIARIYWQLSLMPLVVHRLCYSIAPAPNP